MSKMSDYLNDQYTEVTFTGKEVSTISGFQDAYEATVKKTGEKVWLVCDEDNAGFMSDADMKAHKAGCYKASLWHRLNVDDSGE